MTVNRINQLVDAEDSSAFPVMLAFDTQTSQFTATPAPVPEPSTWVLLAGGVLLLLPHVARGRKPRG